MKAGKKITANIPRLHALMDEAGNLDARYHHVTTDHLLQTGNSRFFLTLEPLGLTYNGAWRMEELV